MFLAFYKQISAQVGDLLHNLLECGKLIKSGCYSRLQEVGEQEVLQHLPMVVTGQAAPKIELNSFE